VLASLFGNFSAPFGSAQESDLQKIRLDDVLQGVSFFAECSCDQTALSNSSKPNVSICSIFSAFSTMPVLSTPEPFTCA